MSTDSSEQILTDAPGNMMLNMGPSHPAMHGVVRIVLNLEGELVKKAELEIGYLHRAFEKHSESVTYTQVFPWTDRLNYVSPLINNFGYAMCVEKLLGIKVTPRCEYVRTAMSEISRITDHLTCIGASAMELGAFTVFLYMIKAREFLYELVEDVTGARVTVTYARIGGVKADLPPNFSERCRSQFKKIREILKECDGLLTHNRIFMDRMQGIGIFSKEDAINFAFSGPMLRASGVPYDVRRAYPYHAYDDIDFEIPVGENGDNFDRYLVRMEEMEQSMRIVEQALDKMPGGPVSVELPEIDPAKTVDEAKMGRIKEIAEHQVDVSPNLEGQEPGNYYQVNPDLKSVVIPPKQKSYTSIEGLMNHFKLIMYGHGIRPPKGEAYTCVEGGNGELGFYIVSDGSDIPYRVRVRAPCFPFVAAFHKMIEGLMIADIVPTFGSINMIAGELDH
ncbi:NADH-quinone oxidoreductase subunit D [bacterium]|nr:NADH-quinone oxidoreductase subunit D [bacterium]MCI0602456.1 NADH-quinone oxidoreductase subunit D [bacterium]